MNFCTDKSKAMAMSHHQDVLIIYAEAIVECWESLVDAVKGGKVMARKQAVAQATMAEMVEMIVKRIVNNPDQVRVSSITCTCTTVIELQVKKGDLGQVIGKKGAIASAIRTIMIAASGRDGKSYRLEILGDNHS